MRDTDVQREINRMSRKYDDDDIQEYARPWRGLTDEELFKIWMGAPSETEDRFAFVKAVIAKLKERNHG